MVGWHHLVEIKRIEEQALSVLSLPHHVPLPPMHASINGITTRESSQWEFCNKIRSKADIDQSVAHLTYSAAILGAPAVHCRASSLALDRDGLARTVVCIDLTREATDRGPTPARGGRS
jgi:hypothetical protein